MDYGQFYVFGASEGDPDLIEKAIKDGAVANDGSNIVVISPHQNNFKMSILIEVWPSLPIDDEEEWQYVTSQVVVIDTNGQLSVSSFGSNSLRISIPPGEYRIDICGRGFVRRGWPGSVYPGDEWRIRIWPGSGRYDLPPTKRWP